jgi:hypothetical protein
MAVVIHQYRLAAGEIGFLRPDGKSLKASVLEHFLFRHLRLHTILGLRADDLGRRMAVVQQGIVAGKPFRREQLF